MFQTLATIVKVLHKLLKGFTTSQFELTADFVESGENAVDESSNRGVF